MFYHGFFLSFFLLHFFFIRPLIAEFAERNATISGHIVGSKCNSKMHVRNLGYPFPLQIGDPKTPFRRFRNLRANLTAYIFGMKHDTYKRVSALQTTRSLLRRLKTTRTLVHKRFQIKRPFRKFCILLYC